MKGLKYYLLTILFFIVIGCGENTTTPEVYEEMSVTADLTHCTDAYGETGAIDLSIVGGKQPYDISWTNGETTEDIKSLKAGSYQVTIIDQTGRRIIESYSINEPIEATVSDINGTVYKTIKIGDQWWMAEDLKTSKNPNGEDLTSYIYEDNTDNLNDYGRLYTWNVAMDGSKTEGARGIAPEGWHIPTKAEWEILFEKLGGKQVAGGALKVEGETYWNSPNTGANNSSKFCGKGSGERAGANENYKFQFQKIAGIYWTSNEGSAQSAYYFVLNNTTKEVREILFHKDYAYSVRCIKD